MFPPIFVSNMNARKNERNMDVNLWGKPVCEQLHAKITFLKVGT